MDKRVRDNDYSVEAVKRLARVCLLFSEECRELSIRDMAERADVPARTAEKIATTLESRGLLCRTAETNHWALGRTWLRIAERKRSHIDIREAAKPVMHWVRAQMNETIILGVPIGDRRVILECLVSTQPIRRMSEVGDEMPLHVGSAGRMILAGWSDAAIANYLSRAELINYGFDTITDPSRIWSDVQKSRRDGYLTAQAEITKESFSVSAPIRFYSGEIVGALTITLPLSRLTNELRKAAIRVTREGARRISQRMGYVAAPAKNSRGSGP